MQAHLPGEGGCLLFFSPSLVPGFCPEPACHSGGCLPLVCRQHTPETAKIAYSDWPNYRPNMLNPQTFLFLEVNYRINLALLGGKEN